MLQVRLKKKRTALGSSNAGMLRVISRSSGVRVCWTGGCAEHERRGSGVHTLLLGG